jgi:hypothetical protein
LAVFWYEIQDHEPFRTTHSTTLDEAVDIYLVLRTPYIDPAALRAYLKRLDIALDVQVVNSQAPDRDIAPLLEDIYSGRVDNTAEPLTLTHDPDINDEDGEPRQTYAVWKISVFLGRPRIRLQSPTVNFTAVASLGAANDEATKPKTGYLTSRTPPGMNLLESFGNDPALGGVKPTLSAQRVSKVLPVTQSRAQRRLIKGLKSLVLKILPVVHTRVRFARPSTAPSSRHIIAMLEVDFTPFFECEALLSSISIAVPSVQVTDLNTAQSLSLPLSCVAHDHITFMYKLSPLEHEIDLSRTLVRDVDISIGITVLLRPGVCTPKLKMSWLATGDFTAPVNPGFGTSLTNPSLQRSHRPSQLSIDGAASLVAPAVSRPDALPGLEAAVARTNETTIPDFGITMTFSTPTEPVYAGNEFCWTVFVVNRSSASVTDPIPPSPPRKLALLVLPRRRRNDIRVLRPPSAHSYSKIPNAKDHLVADAVLDENIVYAMQRSSLVDATDVVCLSADTRVGPLSPNACHVVELRFVALREGIVGIEAIRVVDLATQEHVDVRELPLMMVKKRAEV